MSGKIELKVREGNSKDKRYNFYPEAFLLIYGENGGVLSISPSYNDICQMLVDFRKHELKVDLTRNRKNYASLLIQKIKELIPRLEQVHLTEFDSIESIYYQQEGGKENGSGNQ